MSYLFDSVGFPHSSDEEFARLFMRIKHEGEIVTTTHGIYYCWTIPLDEDFAVELWLKEAFEDQSGGVHPHFIGATEGNIELHAAIPRGERSYADGSFRFDHYRRVQGGKFVAKTPIVFCCPNFDCAEGFELPRKFRVQLCAIAADLQCYTDEAEYRAAVPSAAPEGEHLEVIFPSDYVRGGEIFLEPVSPITYLTGRVEETEILTNPETGCDFVWAVVNVGDFGLIDLVSSVEVMSGFMQEGCIVRGTFWLSGRLSDESLIADDVAGRVDDTCERIEHA
jgi:hypothetical protein